jgi:predicted secreted hydrolase
LKSESGKHYGYQVTFFRFGVRDRQHGSTEPPLFTELYMAHFALSDVTAKKFIFRERINRGIGDKAGAAIDRYRIWNEDWKVEGDAKTHSITVRDRGVTLQLSLRSEKPPVLHGDHGYSRKGEGEGRASYYYSLTRMETSGELTIDGKKEKISGFSWMDHEFGSNQLRDDQVGWDWFSIQLEDGRELMLYQLRRKDGSTDPYSSGTVVSASGEKRHLMLKDFRIEVLEHWKSPKSGARYPIKWKLVIPSEAMEMEITPVFPDQELITSRSTRVTYWEGSVAVRAMRDGQVTAGRGYVEMTGYAGKVSI